MTPTLLLAAAVLAAPIPKDARPPGPPPRVVELTPGADGKVRVTVTRTEKRQVTQRVALAGPKGEVKYLDRLVEVPVTVTAHAELSEVKGLTVYTADGKEADKALALKKLAEGGVVVVSADGQRVDPKFLRLFRDDALVLVSPELTGLGLTAGPRFIGPPVVGTAVRADVGPPLAAPRPRPMPLPPAADPPERPKKD